MFIDLVLMNLLFNNFTADMKVTEWE